MHTRLTLANVLKSNNSASREVTYQIQYNWGVMIEYIEGTNFARLYLDDYGLKFKNISLGIGIQNQSANNFFVSLEASGRATTYSINLAPVIALVDDLTNLVAIWSTVKVNRTGVLNSGTRLYGNTIDEQERRWGKSCVVRRIEFNSEHSYMDTEGQLMTITGGYSANGTPTFSYEIDYTAST